MLKANYTVAQKSNYIKFLCSRKKEIVHYKPITLSIVATGRCNLSCDMCPTHSKLIPDGYLYAQQSTKDMSFQTFKKIIDKFKESIIVQIIGAAEPLLNRDLFKMIDYAGSKKMKVKTFSNGVVVSDYIDEITNSKLNNITISINGHNKEEFHRMTGMPEDIYLKIYVGVKKLIEKKNKNASKVSVKLSFIIDRQNYKDISRMIGLSEELGVDGCLLCNFLPSPFDGFNPEERCIFSDDSEVINSIQGFKRNLTKRLRKKVSFPVFLDRACKKKKCNIHFYQIRIDGKEQASSCSTMLLNMNGNPHFLEKDIWNHTFFKSMRRKFLKKNATLDWPCRFCPSNFGIDLL